MRPFSTQLDRFPALIVILTLGIAACGAPETGAPTSEADDAGPVVATVGNRSIRLAELDESVRQNLFQREAARGEQSLYRLRMQSLERMLDEHVIDGLLAGSGKTRDEYVLGLLQERGQDVTEADVLAWVEENQGRLREGLVLDEIRPRIVSRLRADRARAILVELRGESGAKVLLDPPRVDIAADGPALGPADARITLVEFSDFQCPYCRESAPIVKALAERYPEDVRIVYRHLPLSQHPRAQAAAEASLCAHDQGGFWPYHDRVFAEPEELTDADLSRMAEASGLDVARFEGCVAEGRFRSVVLGDAEAARSASITGTPTFVLNGIVLAGPRSFEELSFWIEGELARPAQDG